MAEERLTNQDLANFLIKKHGYEKEESEAFVKEFFLIIEEALEKDKIAKVKGFGTFKLIEVKSRESINVNTGERFEIQEHTKVTFTPDPLLRDIINKPFAHFETIILKDGVNFGDEPEDENSEEENNIGNTPKCIGEPFMETPDVEISRIGTPDETIHPEDTPVSDEPAQVDSVPGDIVVEPEEIKDGNQVEPGCIETQELIIEPPTENKEEEQEEVITSGPEPKVPLEEIIARELQETNRFFNKSINGGNPDKPASGIVTHTNNSRPSRRFITITIILAIFICGTAVLFTYFPTFLDDFFGYKNHKEVANLTTPIDEPSPITAIAEPVDQPQEDLEEFIKDPTGNISSNSQTETEVIAGSETPVVTQNQSKPDGTKKTEIAQRTETKTTQPTTNWANDNTPVKPDSTSYKITGTKTTHTIQSGETLTRISLRFYGTKDLWPYLVMHNRVKIPNPSVVPAGLIINIPELEKK